jgi:hypothetical protein
MAERIEPLKEDHLDECAHLLMVAFNAEPWNDNYTLDTAKKQLAWTLRVPGCVGLVSIADGVVAFAICEDNHYQLPVVIYAANAALASLLMVSISWYATIGHRLVAPDSVDDELERKQRVQGLPVPRLP